MRFADIVGQERLKRQLVSSVQQGRIPHAQLFTGRVGYGTLPLAIAYAQYINCSDRQGGESCGRCPSCRQIEMLSHPDLHFVLPVNKQGKSSGEAMLSDNFMDLFRDSMSSSAGYLSREMWDEALNLGKTLKGSISVKEADEIIRKLSFKSFLNGYKVVIIWQPERLNEAAANKLLKILEEPWERTLFILVSETPELLLPTILSRVQEVNLPRVEESDIVRYARERGFEAAERVARVVGGDVIELKRVISGEGGEQRKRQFELFSSLMRYCYADRHLELLEWADEVSTLTQTEQIDLLRYAIMMLRESYVRHAGLPELCYTWGAEGGFCDKFAPFVGNENIEFLVSHIEESIAQLSQNANANILFTHFALRVSKEIVKR
ncbi:MAG: DNA polymerase III subunit delta' [Rikenellaceae bacterium]